MLNCGHVVHASGWLVFLVRVGIIFVFVHVFVLLSDFLLSCKHLCGPLISSEHAGGSRIKFNEIPRVKGADELPFNRLSVFLQIGGMSTLASSAKVVPPHEIRSAPRKQ